MSDKQNMDPAQLHKMTEVMGADLRSIKEELQKEREEKERIVREQQAREEEFKLMQTRLNAVKDEKKQYYSGVIDDKVKPYLESLRKHSDGDVRFGDSLSQFQQQLDVGLDNAFMDPSQLATLQVAVAASADAAAAEAKNQVTSSKLEELFQSQKQWEDKFSTLQKEKEEIERVKIETEKKMEESNSVAEKLTEELKKELSELRAKHESSITNAEDHFDKAADVVPETTVPATVPETVPETFVASDAPAVSATIPATASSSSNFHGGFNTLFDFTPRQWNRSNDL